MADNIYRKCTKCGRSPKQVRDLKLSRFPKPGPRNAIRCESWAKYCFPNSPWSSPKFQEMLYHEHKMLCYEHQALALQEFMGPSTSLDNQITSEPGLSFSNVLKDVTNTDTQHHKDQVLKALAQDLASTNQPGPSLIDDSPIPSTSKTQMQDHQMVVCVGVQTQPMKKTDRENYLYKKCRQSMKKICQLKKTIHKMRKGDALNILEPNKSVAKLMKRLTPSFALMLQAQLKNFRKKYKGRRWTFDEKVVALRLFKRSPTCYRLLRRMWCLPSPSTLNNLLRLFSLKTGINTNIFNSLKENVKKRLPSDNEYILMFDEMSIKKHLEYNNKEDMVEGYQDHGVHGRTKQEATHALVFMIKAIREKTKQPIAYYLSSSYVTADRLKAIIKEVIEACLKVGVNIAATVCDMDGVNRRVLTLLGATKDSPYFNINGTEVIALFDAPHLLKCFRNLFLKYDIQFPTNIRSVESKGQGVGVAKWSHIQDFYEMDNSNEIFVFAPKLRKEHLNPNAKQKMRVNLAAQVFSHSVAAGLYSKISDGVLTTEALATAELVSKMDKLFDLLNSRTSDLENGKPHATNISDTSPHREFFNEMRLFFNSLKYIGCQRAPPSIMGWLWTMKGVETLYNNLKKKHENIKSLSTRALQQDPLENLFGSIRANCGSNANPTVRQFVGALKSAIFSKLNNPTRGNCEDDENNAIIENFKKLLNRSQIHTDQALSLSAACDDSVIDDFMLSITESFDESVGESSAEMQACAYVCGFILKKIKNTCVVCKKIFTTLNVDEKLYLFTTYKEYNDYKSALKYASVKFVECVAACAKTTYEILKTESHTLCIKKVVKEKCKNSVSFSFLSKCHKAENIEFIVISVFHICIKRFCIVKNREFKEATSTALLKRKMDIIKHI